MIDSNQIQADFNEKSSFTNNSNTKSIKVEIQTELQDKVFIALKGKLWKLAN